MSAPPPGGIWALIPVKPFDEAKSRLSPALTASRRAAVAREWLVHLLDVLAASPSVAGIAVVTASEDAGRLAALRGAVAIQQAAGSSLGSIVDAALIDLAGRGAGAALVLMSDLPLVARPDIDQLCALVCEYEVVVAPDARRRGTNALGLRPPDRLPTCFGRDDSFTAHCARAAEAALRLAVLESERLAFDVDAPEDLARLRE